MTLCIRASYNCRPHHTCRVAALSDSILAVLGSKNGLIVQQAEQVHAPVRLRATHSLGLEILSSWSCQCHYCLLSELPAQSHSIVSVLRPMSIPLDVLLAAMNFSVSFQQLPKAVIKDTHALLIL